MTLLLAIVCWASVGESRIRNPESGIPGIASARILDSGFWIPAPQESAQRLKAGQEKLKVRDFEGAIPDFERCLELQPGEYNASFGLGICLWEKDEFAKARRQFSRVVELVEKEQPGAPLLGVHQKLLGCSLLLEDFDAAVAEASRLIKIQPTAEYYYARGLARQRKGELKEALEDGASALKEDGLLTKARTLRAEILLAQGEEKAAQEEIAASIQAKPSDPGAMLARACVHYRRERWAEALADLKAAKKLYTGQNSDLESQAYATALTWICQVRTRSPEPASEEAKRFAKQLRELKRSPAKNHLLTLPLYLAGEETEAGLLRAAEEAPARKAQARCEAWFFIAERKLLEGDAAGAREAFRSCAGTGARGILEHDLALLRLKVLGE